MGAMTDTIGDRVLCDAECVAKLEATEKVTTASGLQYQDIVKGRGPVPEVGYQVRLLGFSGPWSGHSVQMCMILYDQGACKFSRLPELCQMWS